MNRRVLVSATAAESFTAIPPSERKRIRSALEALAHDPFGDRSDIDVKRLQATTPTKYRLRVGSYRVVFVVDRDTVRVLDVFRRERGYRE